MAGRGAAVELIDVACRSPGDPWFELRSPSHWRWPARNCRQWHNLCMVLRVEVTEHLTASAVPGLPSIAVLGCMCGNRIPTLSECGPLLAYLGRGRGARGGGRRLCASTFLAVNGSSRVPFGRSDLAPMAASIPVTVSPTYGESEKYLPLFIWPCLLPQLLRGREVETHSNTTTLSPIGWRKKPYRCWRSRHPPPSPLCRHPLCWCGRGARRVGGGGG